MADDRDSGANGWDSGVGDADHRPSTGRHGEAQSGRGVDRENQSARTPRVRPDWGTWAIVVVVFLVGAAIIALWWWAILR